MCERRSAEISHMSHSEMPEAWRAHAQRSTDGAAPAVEPQPEERDERALEAIVPAEEPQPEPDLDELARRRRRRLDRRGGPPVPPVPAPPSSSAA
jgi:hypothetical protein